MQEEGTIEHSNAKCHVLTLIVNLLTIVYLRYRRHTCIEHTNGKIVESTLTSNVMRLC